jgi:hypothetical protein
MHRPRLKRTNVDALSRNPVGSTTDDNDFNEEIQDIRSIQTDTCGTEGEILSVQTGKKTKWFDFRRQDKGLLQQHECCFGINHWRYAKSHQLYMVDVVPKEDQHKELVPHVKEMKQHMQKGVRFYKIVM